MRRQEQTLPLYALNWAISSFVSYAYRALLKFLRIFLPILVSIFQFADRLHVDVFSKLDGGDHSRFLLYYDMMQAAVSAGAQDEVGMYGYRMRVSSISRKQRG